MGDMGPQDHNDLSGEYYDLGPLRRSITTRSPAAQLWFNRGVKWCYGFNHEEAYTCFKKATRCDPQCAMAYWGIAYALGPNYNKPWAFFGDVAREKTLQRIRGTLEKAKEFAAKSAPVEKALISALEYRYKSPGGEDPQLSLATRLSLLPLDTNDERAAETVMKREAEDARMNQAFADKMEAVYTAFPHDFDVATIYADAMMNLTPWKLWDIRTGLPREGARTMEVKRVLERALAQKGGLKHPGLIHLYIHLMEMSTTPEAALTIADNLRGLVPDSGHLNHMPTHLDILCGDYRRAIASNSDAIRVDEKSLASVGPMSFYTLYRMHNYHFLIYAAMFSGQSKIALGASSKLADMVPESLLRAGSMADLLEGFLGTHIHALIRFGRWQDIIDIPFPSDSELYCVTTAMLRYGKGVALAATSRIEEAMMNRTAFELDLKRIPASRTIFNNSCKDILAVASAMLDGEIAYRSKDYEKAFSHLRLSVKLYDSLPYDEPWGWMQPTRHALGALLLEQGRAVDAAKVYSADLGLDSTLPRALQHPNNVWSLHGYHECLLKLGQDATARILEPQLRLALAIADIPIKGSCFCRL